MQICPECGQSFDGGQCWACVARMADIEETFSLSFPVALAAITIGNIIAISIYTPLGPEWTRVYMIPGVSFLFAVALSFVLRNQMPRYALLIRLTIVFVAVTCLLPATYFLLNGILDGDTPTEISSLVISKHIGQGTYGGPDLFVRLSWRQHMIEQAFRVDSKTYSAVEPGDSVRVVIHPGAFSQPWYSDRLLLNERAPDSR
jgi:hypothetical protein